MLPRSRHTAGSAQQSYFLCAEQSILQLESGLFERDFGKNIAFALCRPSSLEHTANFGDSTSWKIITDDWNSISSRRRWWLPLTKALFHPNCYKRRKLLPLWSESVDSGFIFWYEYYRPRERRRGTRRCMMLLRTKKQPAQQQPHHSNYAEAGSCS